MPPFIVFQSLGTGLSLLQRDVNRQSNIFRVVRQTLVNLLKRQLVLKINTCIWSISLFFFTEAECLNVKLLNVSCVHMSGRDMELYVNGCQEREVADVPTIS